VSQLAAEAGIKLRPHTKIHESAFIAKLQIQAGACGVEVGNVDQAEALADEGIDDIVIAHPFYGSHKLEKLKRLLRKPGLNIAIVVDMFEQGQEISKIGKEVGRKVPLLLKIETGGNRYGVLPGEPALKLAKTLSHLQDVDFQGIYAHEFGGELTIEGINKMAFEVASVVTETAKMLKKGDVKIEHVSVGASDTFRSTCRFIKEKKFPEITEIHPGAYVIGDMTYVRKLAIAEDRCAVTVLTSVMSTSHADHAVLDAGSKTFGADSIIAHRNTPGFFWEGRPSFGSIRDHSDLWLGRLSDETSVVYYKDPKKKLSSGERLEVVPNNAAIVINAHDHVYGVRNGEVEMEIPITGKNRGN
jgi:D-serine deaminase-like pyridoxal phosphate-dependent protein